MPTYYSLIDVFFQPSLRDGMPKALLEAMACEKTVIGTPVGRMLDVLEDGKNGMLVEVNNGEMLANKICGLLENARERETIDLR